LVQTKNRKVKIQKKTITPVSKHRSRSSSTKKKVSSPEDNKISEKKYIQQDIEGRKESDIQ
jgi:hypothetical protein